MSEPQLHEMSPLILWGSTRCGDVKLQIFVNHDPDFNDCDGCTDMYRGNTTLHLHPRVLRNQKHLRRILIHEFTHIIEYLNDPEYLDPTRVNECSALAQTMEVGMTDLITNLRVGKRKFQW